MKMTSLLLTAVLASGSIVSLTAGASALSSVKEAREMTQTAGLPVLNLGLTPAEQAELNKIPFRFFSSIEMKRRFQPAIAKLVLDERLGGSLQLDPGKSALDHRKEMFQYRKSVCDKAIETLIVKDARTKKSFTGDTAFLDQMQGMSPRILKSSEGDAIVPAPIEAKLVSAVNAQLAKAAAQLNGESPTKVFGPLVSIDAFGGEHFRLHFKNLKADVSLPMMISYMTQQDNAFVRVLDCASRHLSGLMVNKAMHDKYFGMAPNRLADTLKQKGLEAREANRLMSRLSVAQLRTMIDTLIQLDASAIMSPSEFNKKDAALVAATSGRSNDAAQAARLEFLQFLNRELGDYRDVKASVIKMRLQAQK